MPARPSRRRTSAARRGSAPWRPKRAALSGVLVAAGGAVLAAIIVTASYTRSDDGERRALATAYPVPGRPSAIAVASDRVWVADDLNDVVRVLTEQGGRRVRDPIPVAADPVSIAADATGDTVWVAHAGGVLTRIDAATGGTEQFTVEGLDAIVAVAPADDAVWVGDIAAGVIVRVDARTGAADAPVSVPGGVVRLVVADGVVWVTNLERTVTPVDAPSGRPGRPIEVGLAPIGLAVVDDEVWVASSEEDTVVRVAREARRAIGDPLPAGDAPVALAPVGDVVWVVSQEDRSARALDRETGQPRGERVELGSRPRGIAASGQRAWVAAVDSGAAILLR